MKLQLRHFSLVVLFLVLPRLVLAEANNQAAAAAAGQGANQALTEAALLGAAGSKSSDKSTQMLLMMMMMMQQQQQQAFQQNQKQNSGGDSKSSSSDDKKDENKIPQPSPLPSTAITPQKPDETNLVTLDGLKPKPNDTSPVTSTVDVPDFVPPQVSLNKPAANSTAPTTPTFQGVTTVPQAIPQNKADANGFPSGTGALASAAGGDIAGLGNVRAPGVKEQSQPIPSAGTPEEGTSKGAERQAAPQEAALGGGGSDMSSEGSGKSGGGSPEDFFSMLNKGNADDPNAAPPDGSRDLASEPSMDSPAPGAIMNIFQIAQVRYQYAAYKEKRILTHAQ